MASVKFSIMQKNVAGQYLGHLAFQAHSKDEDGTGSVSWNKMEVFPISVPKS
jgi:hypothetical protein